MNGPRFPSPSKRFRHDKAPYVSWFLNNAWVRFRIIADDVALPESANLIGHVILDDHLEELWQDDEQFFRHAGGGRGFYWTQELRPAT